MSIYGSVLKCSLYTPVVKCVCYCQSNLISLLKSSQNIRIWFSYVGCSLFTLKVLTIFFSFHYSLRTWSRPYWLRFPNASSTQRSRPHCCPGRSGCRRLGPFWRSKVYQCCPGSSGGGSLPAWGRSHSLWPCYGLCYCRGPNRRHLGLWFKQ